MPAQRRESRSSACTICRQPAAPGSNLCAPCRSALKRARDSTVSEAILPLRRQRKRPATTPATPAAESAPQGASAHRWVRGAWAVALGGVLVAGGAWIVHTRGNAGTIAPRYAVAAPESGAETIKAAATTAASTVSTAPAERAAVAAPGVDPAPRSLDARSLPSTIAVPRVAPHAEAAVPLPLGPAVASPSVVEAPPPAPIVVAQAPAPRAPPPDRWQRLADALARCPADDLVARTMCQESLRLEHCDGFWGRVAACPARSERDYGN